MSKNPEQPHDEGVERHFTFRVQQDKPFESDFEKEVRRIKKKKRSKPEEDNA